MADPSTECTPARNAGEPRTAVARNALFLVAGQVATTALAILMSAALGRSLGADDFGVYFLVSSMGTFAYVLVEWGQSFLVIREVARHPDRAGDLLGTTLALRAAGAALLSVPVGVVAWWLGYDVRTCWLAVLFVATALPLYLAQAYGMIFRGFDRMGLDATVSVVNKTLALLVVVGALLLGTGIPGVLVAQAVAGVGALAVAGRLFRRLGAGRLRADRATARFVLREGASIVTMSAAVAVQPYLDAVILSKLVPAAVVGWYGAAKSVMGTLVAPSVILAAASYPRISRAAHDPHLLGQEFRAAMRPMLWLGALAGAGTFLFGAPVVELVYGARGFGPAGVVLQVFGPSLFLLFVDVLLGHVITAAGRATGFAVAKVGSVVVSTVLNVLLVPVFQERTGNGGIGIVVAFGVSEFVVLGGALWLMPRGSLDLKVAADAAKAIVSAAVTVLAFRLLPAMPVLLGIPLSVGIFTALSVALRLVTRGDIELVRALLRRGKSRPADH